MYSIKRPVCTLLITCFFVALVFGSMSARGASPFTKEIAGEPQQQVIEWAKPLAGGPLKALFIAPRFTLCDLTELEKRLDLHYESVPLWTSASLGYDPVALPEVPEHGSRDETLALLNSLLNKRWDVIILANFNTAILPEPVLSTILEQVAAGTGFMAVHLHDPVDSPLMTVLQVLPTEEEAPLPSAGIGGCAFPGDSPLETIGAVLRHEKGRVVLLEYPGDPPHNHCLIQVPAEPVNLDPAYKNNAFSLVIRALCIAARRTNPVRILSVRDISPSGPDDLEIPPDFYPEFVQSMRDSAVAQPSRPFQLILDRPADQRYTVQAQLRRTDSSTQISYEDKTPFLRGDVTHAFEIPAGPGVYMLDTWLFTRSGVADWFTAEITVPGWPEFHDLRLEKQWLLPNDSLELTLAVRPVLSTGRRGALYARAQDGFGRIVSDAVQGVSHEGGNITLRLHFSDLLSSLIKVEVFALDSEPRPFSEWELHCAFREVRYLSVRRPSRTDTLELVAATGLPREYAAAHFLSTLSSTTVTTLHAPGGETAIVAAARAHLAFLPELARVAAEQARDGVYREPCLNDPDYRDNIALQLRESTLKHWAGSRAHYSLGNRNYLIATEANVCQCGYCLDKFQSALQADYGDLTALNQAWQTEFGDWDFIELPRDMGPGHQGPVAPWMDFRRFMTHQFSNFHGWGRAQVVAADTEGQTGARFAGNTNVYYGYHWPDLFQTLDFAAAPYSPLFFEKIRSYAKPGSFSGVTLPNAHFLDNSNMLSWLPWRLALNQIPALWLDTLWGDAAHAATDAWLLPDGAATPALETLTETVGTIRDSVGPLLYAAEKTAPTVAVYDSEYSRYLSEVNTDYSTTRDQSQEAAVQLLRLAGYAFRFIGKAELAALDTTSFPVLILPFCRALDKDERAALRAFVGNGGALIADIVPGTFDAHGQRLTESGLNDVFGIDQEQELRIKQGVLTTDGAAAAGAADAGWADVDESVLLQGGIALAKAGKTPAWIVNRAGNGHTLLLNHPFRSVQHQEGRRLVPAEAEAMAVFLQDLPDLSGKAELISETFLGNIYQYHFGQARIYAIQSDVDAPKQKLRLPLKAGDAAYNARTGEPIRRPHRHTFLVSPGTVEIVSCLPYEVQEVSLETPKTVHPGQHLPLRIFIDAGKGKPGKHLFLVDLLPANRPPLPWYRRIVHTVSGVAELYLPLARNELPGWYTLRVRDCLTGMETTTTIKISLPVE